MIVTFTVVHRRARTGDGRDLAELDDHRAPGWLHDPLVLLRAGKTLTLPVTGKLSGGTQVIGVQVQDQYKFPFNVRISVDLNPYCLRPLTFADLEAGQPDQGAPQPQRERHSRGNPCRPVQDLERIAPERAGVSP